MITAGFSEWPLADSLNKKIWRYLKY